MLPPVGDINNAHGAMWEGRLCREVGYPPTCTIESGSMGSRPWTLTPAGQLPTISVCACKTTQHVVLGRHLANLILTCSSGNPFTALDGSGNISGTHRMGGLGFGLPMSRLYAQYFGEDCACSPNADVLI